jgi:D-tyrosyl-tRNA(Tyr) deacylase
MEYISGTFNLKPKSESISTQKYLPLKYSLIFHSSFFILHSLMRSVIQRVSAAEVRVDGKITGKIGLGLLVLVGIEEGDGAEDIEWLSGKIINLRIFDDEQGIMNRSVADVKGDLLVVSQFTLHASIRKGNRPSYIRAAKPETAVPLYEKFLLQLETDLGKPVSAGIFGAMMKVSLLNDGPITIVIDTKNRE